MYLTRLIALALSSALIIVPASAKKKSTKSALTSPAAAPVARPMTPDEKVLHALNRLAFGPRPGDVQRVQEMGLSQWIEGQLRPGTIAENPELESRLQKLDTLSMSTAEMVEKYPPNQAIRQMVSGKIAWPADADTRLIVQHVANRYKNKVGIATDQPEPDFNQVLATLTPVQQQALRTGKPPEKVAVLAALPLQQQYDVVVTMPVGQRQAVYAAAPVALRRRMQTFGSPQAVVNQDLADAKILRAVYSNRQLSEVLTDFWYNHFNVFLDKGADRYMVTAYERDAIRPFVLGKFKDLLTATAQSPAMLFYLDNFQSVRADLDSKNPNAKARRGLNENYGRELMELHTLGVDGGYTQKDVTEVARCFTGWTIREARYGGAFEFREKLHDTGEKHVLGVTIPAGGGIDDGYKVIDILSHHPATARFIARSLAVRFVSDTPPQALVDRMAASFTASDGDLRQVMQTMIDSPEFWSEPVYRAKIKSPFEMLASALRATNASIDFTSALGNQLNQLGEPLYRKVEPTGYSNKSTEWMNSASLLGRMNFALNLTANKIAGVKLILPSTADPDAMSRSLIGTDLTAESRHLVDQGLAAPAQPAVTDGDMRPALKPVQFQSPTPAMVAGLTLGSPDFQRR